MKVKLDIDDDCTDAITIATLRRTLKAVSDKRPNWKELWPDGKEIASACKLLIKYYAPYGQNR